VTAPGSGATGIAVFGLLVGLPLGVLIGREGWRWVANRVPSHYEPPFSLIPLLVIVPVAIVLVNALALWPGHRIGRQRPVDHLRTE
jgi:hypothetical protein